MRADSPWSTARQLLLPLAILAGGLSITGWLVSEQASSNRELVESQFRSQVERIGTEIARRVHDYEHGLKSTRSVIEAVGERGLTRGHFRAYKQVRDIDVEFPGSRGFGFVRRVPQADTDRFLTAARLDGWPDFRIRELSPNAGERFVIQYIEPVERNLPAIGLDIASERNRRTAAVEAIRLDRATITEPITLVQATGAENRAFLILLPLYRPGMPVKTPADRDAATWGWAYATLVLDEVIADLLKSVPGVRWSVSDMAEEGRLVRVFSQGQTFTPDDPYHSMTLPVFSRLWWFEAQASPQFVAQFRLPSPLVVGAWGSMVTLLLMSASLLWARSRRREREGLAAKAQLATIVEHSDRAVVGQDNDGEVILWNRSAEVLFGIPASQVLGLGFEKVLQAHALQLTPMDRVEGAESGTMRELSLTGNGREPRVLLESKSPIFSTDDRLLGSATLLADVTERRAMEDALASSNQRLEQKVDERTQALAKAEAFLQTVLDSVPSVIAYWNVNGECLAANTAFLNWRGLSRDALQALSLQDVLPPARSEGLAEDLKRAWKGERRAIVFSEQGWPSMQWRSFSGALIPDVQGEVVQGLYFVADDVTELLRSEQELETALISQHAQRMRLEGIIEGTNAGTWEWNIRTGETRFNERWAKILGERLADLSPTDIQTWRQRIHPDDVGHWNRLLDRHFQGEEPRIECEMRLRHREGHWVWVLTHGRVTTWTSDDQPEWMFGTLQDLTQRRKMEDSLREATRQANAASAAKTRFLASMSHEIRTPLNALLGMHRMLKKTGLDAKQSEWLTKADRAGRSLLELLNNVLDLGKIEAGEMGLQPEVFNLRDLFDELLSLFAPSAMVKDIEFAAHLTGERDCWVVADRMRLRQVLVNLVGNSIKFTESGGVLLLGQREPGPQGGRLLITVRDSGIGIAPDAIPHLFQPFVQADGSTARRFGGSGLGLSIVRSLVDLMGGTISVSSNLDTGSSFCVNLPLVDAPESEVRQAQEGQRQITVGYLCGSQSICREIAHWLSSLGWQGVNCAEALPEEVPDVLLLDAALAGEAEDAVDHLARGGEAFPMSRVVMAGSAAELRAINASRLGGARTITTPVTVSAFNNILDMLSGAEDAQERLIRQAALLSTGVRLLEGVRVIVVDDNEINREIVIELLRSQGATCEEYASGQEVLQRLQYRVEDVDAVLMDVQMPVMDGLQATQALRRLPGARSLPVVALSAGVLQSERDLARQAGMQAFLSKPLEPIQVVQVLRQVIREHRGRSVEVALSSRDVATDARLGAETWPEVDGIDGARARVQVNGDAVLFRRLLNLLKNSYDGWSTQWLVPGRTWDASAVHSLCASLHKLRGSAGMVGAVRLAETTSKAEYQIREAGQVQDLSLLESVSRELERVLAGIEAQQCPDAPSGGEHPPAHRTDAGALPLEPLNRLLGQIRANDMDAMETASELRPWLQRILEGPGLATFEGQLDGLRFRDAGDLLEAAMRQHQDALT